MYSGVMATGYIINLICSTGVNPTTPPASCEDTDPADYLWLGGIACVAGGGGYTFDDDLYPNFQCCAYTNSDYYVYVPNDLGGCHIGIAWIELSNVNDNVVFSTCVPNDEIQYIVANSDDPSCLEPTPTPTPGGTSPTPTPTPGGTSPTPTPTPT
jgi:hypothetical protein